MVTDGKWLNDSLSLTPLGATSIKKKPKKFGFWTPPPLLEKGPYQRKCWYFVPNSNYKVRFFQSFNPPPISSESRTSPIFTIEVAPKRFMSTKTKITNQV